MKRCLFKLALFLILGALVNVAVAWGCTWPASDQFDLHAYPFPKSEAIPIWEVRYFSNLGWRRRTDSEHIIFKVHKRQVTSPGFTQRYYYEMSEPRLIFMEGRHGQIIEAFVVQIQAGWPLVCLEGDVWLPTQTYNSGWTQDPVGIVRIGDNHLLPIRVVNSGFLVNTLFYATALWLLTLAPFTARRMIRRKRGLCIKCGYDLRGTEHERCPECGYELSARTKS